MTRLKGADSKVWDIAVEIAETPDETQAVAKLTVATRELAGFGRARRNPADPAVPKIGEELATARALTDLAHELLEEAMKLIEQHEPGSPTAHL